MCVCVCVCVCEVLESRNGFILDEISNIKTE